MATIKRLTLKPSDVQIALEYWLNATHFKQPCTVKDLEHNSGSLSSGGETYAIDYEVIEPNNDEHANTSS